MLENEKRCDECEEGFERSDKSEHVRPQSLVTAAGSCVAQESVGRSAGIRSSRGVDGLLRPFSVRQHLGKAYGLRPGMLVGNYLDKMAAGQHQKAVMEGQQRVVATQHQHSSVV